MTRRDCITYLLGGLTAGGLALVLGCGRKKTQEDVETNQEGEERLQPNADGTYPREDQGGGGPDGEVQEIPQGGER